MNKINVKLVMKEFEKRYTKNVRDTEWICEEIAQDYGYDPEETKDTVYIHRYENF